jgi:hypothetical protein
MLVYGEARCIQPMSRNESYCTQPSNSLRSVGMDGMKNGYSMTVDVLILSSPVRSVHSKWLSRSLLA